MSIEDYVRISEEKEEASIIYFQKTGSEKRVVLAGAVHLASKKFYETLIRELNKYDIIMSEGIINDLIPGGDELSKTILNLVITIDKFHTKLIEGVNKKYKEIISDVVSDLIKKKFSGVREENRIKAAEKKLYERLRLESQQRLINASTINKLVVSDLTTSELYQKINKNSLTNEFIRAYNNEIKGLLEEEILEEEIKRVINNGIIEKEKNLSMVWNNINYWREQRVLEDFDKTQEIGFNKVGMLYGIRHLPSLERGLRNRGFERTRIDFIEVHPKIPYRRENREKKKIEKRIKSFK